MMCLRSLSASSSATPSEAHSMSINGYGVSGATSDRVGLSVPSDAGFKAGCRLAFVYGTLKKGFGNQWLMDELVGSCHARFVGSAYTSRRYPLVCGPFQVPFLLYTSNPCGHQVRGELYQIDDFALAKLDDLEGVSKGHYERRPLDVVLQLQNDPNHHNLQLQAEAYFASSKYAHSMASCAQYIPCYTEKEASNYVRRKDRPQNRTFLEHVYAWIDEAKVDTPQERTLVSV